jgi:hypothetical protein
MFESELAVRDRRGEASGAYPKNGGCQVGVDCSTLRNLCEYHVCSGCLVRV